ncbi:MAG: patatin-like phospholipase family protein [Syntrophobacteraceae bacterium]
MPFGDEGVKQGIALACSGGGFRATLFHLGSIWRLNELGTLRSLKRISSVSGGSITCGLLGVRWHRLNFQGDVATNFDTEIVKPLRDFCAKDIDVPAIAEGAFIPWKKISDMICEAYEELLFQKDTLQVLPDEPAPRFVFNSTNFQTGVDFRFSKPYAGDYRLGLLRNPQFSMALAVAASSAFPPFLSPVIVETDPKQFQPVKGADLCGLEQYCNKLYLTDGGVYDNLGLETVLKRYDTILASDAGAPIKVDEEVGTAWHQQALRAADIAVNQTRSLRKRALIDDFKNRRRKGTYWGIKTEISEYGSPNTLPCDPAKVKKLALIRTRLNSFSEQEQCELINWGYALCDAAMRSFVLPGNSSPNPTWPYRNFALG